MVIKYAMLHYLWDPWCCGEANHPIHLDKGLANDKRSTPAHQMLRAK